MKTPADNRGDGRGRKSNKGNVNFTRAFQGTANPRHLRAIAALRRRPMPREHLDRAAGCSNGPELVAELRRRGLEVPCERVPDFDRDGRPIKRGVYHFTDGDRRRILRWLAKRARHDG